MTTLAPISIIIVTTQTQRQHETTSTVFVFDKKLLSKPPHPMQLNGSPQDPQMNIMIIISLISYCSYQLQLQIELRLALIS